jgi:hypothetical protein
MCGRQGAFFVKPLKIIIMGLKPAENGAPEHSFSGRGCGKFERRAWQRASYRQTEIAYATRVHLKSSQPTEMQFAGVKLNVAHHTLCYHGLLRILKVWNCLRPMRLSVSRHPSAWR